MTQDQLQKIALLSDRIQQLKAERFQAVMEGKLSVCAGEAGAAIAAQAQERIAGCDAMLDVLKQLLQDVVK